MNTQKNINNIAYKIVGCAIEVHKHIGPGLLESVYDECLIDELKRNNLHVRSQVYVPLKYKDKKLSTNLKLELLVKESVIVELKSVEQMIPLYAAQLLSYLKLTDKPNSLSINFNSENISKQLISLVSDNFAKLPKE